MKIPLNTEQAKSLSLRVWALLADGQKQFSNRPRLKRMCANIHEVVNYLHREVEQLRNCRPPTSYLVEVNEKELGHIRIDRRPGQQVMEGQVPGNLLATQALSMNLSCNGILVDSWFVAENTPGRIINKQICAKMYYDDEVHSDMVEDPDVEWTLDINGLVFPIKMLRSSNASLTLHIDPNFDLEAC